jgi:hypothetical protein
MTLNNGELMASSSMQRRCVSEIDQDKRHALRCIAVAVIAGVLLAGCGKWSMPKMHMPNWLWWKKPPPELPLVNELAITSQTANAAGEKFEQRRDYETLAIDVYGGSAGRMSMIRRDADRPWPFHLVFRFHLSTIATFDVYGDQHVHMTPGAPNTNGLVVVTVPTHVYSSQTERVRMEWSTDTALAPVATSPPATP